MSKSTGAFSAMSAQQIISCSKTATGNKGCAGGNPRIALKYIMQKGIMRKSDYPFVNNDDECYYHSSMKIW